MSRNPKQDTNLFLLIFRLLDEGYSCGETFKELVVQEYLTQDVLPRLFAIKYNISADSTVRKWIKRYTLIKESVSYSPLLEVYLIKDMVDLQFKCNTK